MGDNTVPAFVPDFGDPDLYRSWENTPHEERELWAGLVDFRERCVMKSLGELSAFTPEENGGDIAVIASLWGVDEGEIEVIVMRYVGLT